jgi:hypothetical protein
MKIIVCGPAAAYESDSGEQIQDAEKLKALHGLGYDRELCSTYLGNKHLNDISVSGGAIGIRYDEESKALHVVSEYWVVGHDNGIVLGRRGIARERGNGK